MVVLVLTAVPAGLRGHVTRWLLEISAGVFVGNLTERVRENLWAQVIAHCKSGRAIMVFRAMNEQHLSFHVHHHDWPPIEMDGLQLVLRPNDETAAPPRPKRTSQARALRRHRK